MTDDYVFLIKLIYSILSVLQAKQNLIRIPIRLLSIHVEFEMLTAADAKNS